MARPRLPPLGMGVLGRIRIQERPIGGRNLTCETAGDPADPMTAQRAAIPDRGQLEDYARRLYPQHAIWNLPAWIVCPVRRPPSSDRGIADVLPAWPVHGPVVAMAGDEFDAILDHLVEGHCRKG